MADSAATMTREQVLEEFRQAGALLHGHFILSSGLRSPTDLQCARVLIAEDVVTTGKSSRDCIACIVAGGGSVVAASCLIDHRDGAVDLGAPLIALACLAAPVYEPDSLPLAAVPAVKPGSRISP